MRDDQRLRETVVIPDGKRSAECLKDDAMAHESPYGIGNRSSVEATKNN